MECSPVCCLPGLCCAVVLCGLGSIRVGWIVVVVFLGSLGGFFRVVSLGIWVVFGVCLCWVLIAVCWVITGVVRFVYDFVFCMIDILVIGVLIVLLVTSCATRVYCLCAGAYLFYG